MHDRCIRTGDRFPAHVAVRHSRLISDGLVAVRIHLLVAIKETSDPETPPRGG
jgi:hypothetical protein